MWKDGGVEYRMKSVQFRREREAAWRQLEEILAKADRKGLRALDEDELYRLPTLYRGAVSSLSVARAISLDRALVDYLDSLAARAYVYVYGAKPGYLKAVLRFFTAVFPATVWRLRAAVAASILVTVLGATVGFQLTLHDPDLFFAFMPEEMSAGREPASSREDLLRVLRNQPSPDEAEDGETDDGEADGRRDVSALTLFASYLFTNNARVGMLCFAVGFAAGVPVILVLFSNGLVLGAFAAIHHRRDLGFELWGWLLPHGVTELLAVCLCGAAGLTLGWALVFPGRRRRLDSLARAGRQAAVVVLGTLLMFFLAGLIEGYFRQLVVDDLPRYLLAASTAVLWTWYFLVLGRRAEQGGALGEETR